MTYFFGILFVNFKTGIFTKEFVLGFWENDTFKNKKVHYK